MKIIQLLNSQINSVTTGTDLCTIARMSFIPNSVKTGGSQIAYVTESVEGNTIIGTGTLYGGTSEPVDNINPSFFPVATKGAECAAIVSSLAWADSNLVEGYEFFECTSTAGTTRYFVSGILNSSQTLANDPFDDTNIVAVSNWALDYAQGVMVKF